MPQLGDVLNVRGFKLLLLALLTAAVAAAALTLSTSAQTPGGSDPQETARGRIIARIHDMTGEDGLDDYRVEFGFFPEWAMDEADPWTEAIAPRSDWLPSSRYLTKNAIDARAAEDNRAWLRSSLISVPAQSPRLLGDAQITGRVIARYAPDAEGRLRVEFGFVPEWAFTDTSSTEEAVERLGARNLPNSRYLRVAAIDISRGVWLRSSAIEVPLRAPVVVIETMQPPVIDSLSCSPSSPTVDESVTCTASLSGDAPESWAWSSGDSTGSEAAYTTSFTSAGERTVVSLTVTNAAGSDTASTTLTVEEPLQPPVIDSISCSTESPWVDDELTCAATLSGGAPDSYAWSGGDHTSSYIYHATTFASAGEHPVTLTVTNSAGSDTESITLTVRAWLYPPVIDGITCTPSSPATADEDVTCTAALSGGAPDSYAWSGGVSGGSRAAYSPIFDGNGDYTVSLTVANADGADTESIALTVGQLQAPIIDSINCAPSSPLADEDVTCTANLSGDAPASWAWSGGDGSGDGDSYTTSFSEAGEYAVSLTVTNSAGSDSDSITLTIHDALQAPAIDSISCAPSSPTVDESVTCTADLSGGAATTWAWSDGSGDSDGDSHTTSFSKAGEYAVSLTVTNSAGSDTDSISLTVYDEQQAPVIDGISCSPSSPTVDENVTCTAELSGGAVTTWDWSGGGSSGSGESYTINPGDAGDYAITLTVTNSAGSDSDSITLTVYDEQPPPVIDGISCSPSSPTEGERVTCTASRRGGAPDSWAWSGGDSGGSGESYRTSFSASGQKTVTLTVTNAGGSDTASTTVTVAPRSLPDMEISCSPSSIRVGEGVDCSVINIRDGFYPLSWRAWEGTPTTYVSLSGFSTRFLTPGTKTVSVQVTNGVRRLVPATGARSARWEWVTDDHTTLELETTVQVGVQPPVIDSIDCDPSRPRVGDSVTCTAALSGYAPTSWAWSGGGSRGSGQSYTISPSDSGDYTVSLTVTNADGADTDSIALTVYEAVQPPVINGISCDSSSPAVGASVTCTAALSGGAPTAWAWSGGDSNGSAAAYDTSFGSDGDNTVSLTVTNAGGSDTLSITLTVRPQQLPVIEHLECIPYSPWVGEEMTCRVKLSGGAPDTWAWSEGDTSGSGVYFCTSFSTVNVPFTVTLTVTNSAGSATASFSGRVLRSVPSPSLIEDDFVGPCPSWHFSGYS